MLLIGETLTSSSPAVRTALVSRDAAWLTACARRQLAAGVELLDCNAAVLGAGERAALVWLAELLEGAVAAPLCLDSSDVAVLAAAGCGRRFPPVLNSVAATPPWPELIVELVGAGARLIVQLREGRQLPHDATTRLRWAERALAGAARAGLPAERILLDPVLLPWGHDLVQGAPLLAFVEDAATRWPAVATIVGLSNASFGAAGRSEIHRAWLRALKTAGLGAVILNPFDAELIAIART
jgi:cobalamin-dependent methionine synthase I